MKNIGTKSVNMSDKMVYLAMFSTTIDNILLRLKFSQESKTFEKIGLMLGQFDIWMSYDVVQGH